MRCLFFFSLVSKAVFMLPFSLVNSEIPHALIFFPPYSLANHIYCLCQRSVKNFSGMGCQQKCLEELESIWLLLSVFCGCKGTMQKGNSLACTDVYFPLVKVKAQPWHHSEKLSHTCFSFPFAIFGNENWKCCYRFGV